MPTIYSNGTLELDSQSTIEVLMYPVIEDPSISESFGVHTDLYGGAKKLALSQQMEKILQKDEGCKVTYKDGTALSNRTITTRDLAFGARWCWDEFRRTLLNKLAGPGTNGKSYYSQEITNWMLGQIRGAVKQDIERLAWFGDETSSDDNYNLCTGIFKHITDAQTAGTLGKYTNGNSGTTLTNPQAYQLLENVYTNAPIRLKKFAANQKRIYISGQLWDKILNYLSGLALQNGFITVFNEALPGGIVAKFREVPIIVQYRWDDVFATDFGLEDQNYILYTVKENFVVATDLRTNGMANATMEIYEEPLTHIWKAQGKVSFDTNIIFPQLVSAAY